MWPFVSIVFKVMWFDACYAAALRAPTVLLPAAQTELYEELSLGSSIANVQSMRINVTLPPPAQGSVHIIRRTPVGLRPFDRKEPASTSMRAARK